MGETLGFFGCWRQHVLLSRLPHHRHNFDNLRQALYLQPSTCIPMSDRLMHYVFYSNGSAHARDGPRVAETPRDEETRHLHGSHEPSTGRRKNSRKRNLYLTMRNYTLQMEESGKAELVCLNNFITTYATLQVHRLIFSSKLLSKLHRHARCASKSRIESAVQSRSEFWWVYSMLMRLLVGAWALGTTMERMPSFRLALTFSWSTLLGKEKVRANSPTERSETQ